MFDGNHSWLLAIVAVDGNNIPNGRISWADEPLACPIPSIFINMPSPHTKQSSRMHVVDNINDGTLAKPFNSGMWSHHPRPWLGYMIALFHLRWLVRDMSSRTSCIVMLYFSRYGSMLFCTPTVGLFCLRVERCLLVVILFWLVRESEGLLDLPRRRICSSFWR